VRIRNKDLYRWKQKMAQRSRSLQSLRKLPSDRVEHQLENRFPIDTSKVAIPNTAHWTRTMVQARARTYRQAKLFYPMFDAAEKDSQGKLGVQCSRKQTWPAPPFDLEQHKRRTPTQGMKPVKTHQTNYSQQLKRSRGRHQYLRSFREILAG
jgi:hypothetical protein